MKLETARILLRKFEEEDLNALFLYTSQEGVGEAAGSKDHENIDEAKKLIS